MGGLNGTSTWYRSVSLMGSTCLHFVARCSRNASNVFRHTHSFTIKHPLVFLAALMFLSWSQNNKPSQQSQCALFRIQDNHQQTTCASMLQVLKCSPSRMETGKRAIDWDAGWKCIPPVTFSRDATAALSLFSSPAAVQLNYVIRWVVCSALIMCGTIRNSLHAVGGMRPTGLAPGSHPSTQRAQRWRKTKRIPAFST